eukprot:symbB.v1.2.038398.t1/scaffold5961.1/size22113/4
MARSQSDVLSTRQVPVHVDRDDVQYVSEYLKHKLATLGRGQTIPPQLVLQMKTLVNQEFRLLSTCKHFTEACQELLQACESNVALPDDVLFDHLEEVMHFCQDLQHVGQQRTENVKEIVLAERENLQAFRELHTSIGNGKQVQTGLTLADVGALGTGVAMVATGPIAMVAVAVLGIAGWREIHQHQGAAQRMQQALESDMREKNVPIEYMQTFATNLDDAIGLESIVKHLNEIQDAVLKMDFQNVLYRYFADSARYVKKIQHSVRSGEAELLIICDGEEPAADDLSQAFGDFLDSVKVLSTWQLQERPVVQQKLEEAWLARQHLTSKWTRGVCVLLGGMGGFFSTVFLRMSTFEVIGGAVAGAVIVAMIVVLIGCLSRCQKDGIQFRRLNDSWQQMAVVESYILVFLQSLTTRTQSRSYKEALANTQGIRYQLDCFLQRLQMKGLIFDASSMNSFRVP